MRGDERDQRTALGLVGAWPASGRLYPALALPADLGFGRAAGAWPRQGYYRAPVGLGATSRWQKGTGDAHLDLCRFSRWPDPMGCRRRRPVAPDHPDPALVSHPGQLGARWTPISGGITCRPPIAPAIPRTRPHGSGSTGPASPFLSQSAQGFSRGLIPPEFPPNSEILARAGGVWPGNGDSWVTSSPDGDAAVFSCRRRTPKRPPSPPNPAGSDAEGHRDVFLQPWRGRGHLHPPPPPPPSPHPHLLLPPKPPGGKLLGGWGGGLGV